jgi:hypothetical protein
MGLAQPSAKYVHPIISLTIPPIAPRDISPQFQVKLNGLAMAAKPGILGIAT